MRCVRSLRRVLATVTVPLGHSGDCVDLPRSHIRQRVLEEARRSAARWWFPSPPDITASARRRHLRAIHAEVTAHVAGRVHTLIPVRGLSQNRPPCAVRRSVLCPCAAIFMWE